MHFEEQSAVHRTLRKICADLSRHGIPHCVVGGMALFFHGYRRFTEDVDLLVTPHGLKQLHEELDGRGYLPPFEGSINLRDTETGVRIEFLTSGGFPGDGKPKSVVFPDPSEASMEVDGLRFLTLERLICPQMWQDDSMILCRRSTRNFGRSSRTFRDSDLRATSALPQTRCTHRWHWPSPA